MRSSKVTKTIQLYFKNTTLHGFKYLCSVHCVDRIGWLVCCCASACCAGVLCAVLWARFLEVPALLALSDDIRTGTYVEDRLPAIAVCAPPESVADMILEKLSINSTQAKRLPNAFARLLAGKSTANDQLVLLDEVLASYNVTLRDLIMNFTLDCKEYMKRCRYQRELLPCEQMFEKEVNFWGLCCVMRPNTLSNVQMDLLGPTFTTQMIDLVLQCSHGSALYGCQLVTFYEGEEWVEPQTLTASYYYMAQVRFIAIAENPTTLVENACLRDKKYSRTNCMRKCAESTCGCSDPLHRESYSAKSVLPVCSTTRLGCLRANEYKKFDDVTCQCLPTCKKIDSYMVLESSPMTAIKYTIDPLYSGVNVTSDIVVNMRVNVGHSRVFLLTPTETWLTLLSSLGGVFNMFLGVGLFSALEFIYFLLAKLPIAIRKSSEIDPTARYTFSGPVR